jgi:hypothetical protein
MSISIKGVEIRHPTIFQRIQFLMRHHGLRGLYRGILPGTIRSILGNGVSMVVMLEAQRKISEWGWRN